MRYLTEENTLSTRKTACADMLATGWPEALAELAKVIANSADPLAKLAVCQTIAERDDPPASLVEPILSLLDDPDARLSEAAAVALGTYRNGNVVEALARLIRDGKVPVSRRVAAVQALGQVHNVEEAVDTLISVLDDPNNRIRREVIQTLRQCTPVDFGADAVAWRAWWTEGREDLLGGLNRKLRRQERYQRALEDRHVAVLEALFANTADDKRDAQLLAWFQSTIALERQTAVRLVDQQLLDRKPPSTAVATAIRALITDPDPRVRRDVVTVIRDLRQPENAAADAAMLLQTLSTEPSLIVKPTLYNALGRLGDAAAIPVCIAGLADPDDEVVIEAVTAIGWLVQGQRENDGADLTPVVDALLNRFSPLPADAALRRRVVETMAKVQHVKFAPILREEAGDAQPSASIRQTAVRGLELLGNGANTDVVISRLADKDAGVREAAVKAMAALGTTPAHLEAVAARLATAIEPVETLQVQAWETYRTIFGRLQPAVQIEVLGKFPWNTDAIATERFLQLALSVEQKLATLNPAPQELAMIRTQIGDAFTARNRHTDAATAYDKAMAALATAPPDSQHAVFLKLLSARLRAGEPDKLSQLLTGDAPTTRPSADTIGTSLIQDLETILADREPAAAVDLVTKLQPAVAEALGDAWAAKLAAMRATLQNGQGDATPPAPQP
ncbi:MAG: HEAT repeat domain-containing protein [Phycisphaerae bacterium]|nr:HEAT repeat domain-containing protein [Phycisphaerae bacterium]